MALNCGIDGYENNMQILHTTSKDRFGPWQREGLIHPFASTAICAHVLRDPASKKYLIFHTGCGNHSDPNSEGFGTNHSMPITNCRNGSTPDDSKWKYAPTPPPGPAAPGNRTCGVASDLTSIFVS